MHKDMIKLFFHTLFVLLLSIQAYSGVDTGRSGGFVLDSMSVPLLKSRSTEVSGMHLPEMPASPQFEAFKRYGAPGVNHSTGVPEISVPLFEINHYGYRLPLRLDYFPTPLRPGYNYDVCGVGWTLSHRSHISRKLKYLPDEDVDFVVEEVFEAACIDFSCLEERNFSPDIFSCQLPDGSSFDFTIRKHAQRYDVNISNGRPVLIDWVVSGNDLASFEVSTEDGIVYTFSEVNRWSREQLCHNEWHLSSIALPHTEKKITFSYGNIVQAAHYAYTGGYAIKTTPFEDSPAIWCLSTFVKPNNPCKFAHELKLVSRISYGDNAVVFRYDHTHPGRLPNDANFFNYLNTISLYRKAALIQHIELKKTLSDVQGIAHAQLDSVIFRDPDRPELVKAYHFRNDHFYIRNKKLDHWGYYNNGYGENGVSNFVLHYILLPNTVPDFLTVLEPASLSHYYKCQFNAEYNQAGDPGGTHGLLNRITYPTGGYTEFVFERHKFLTSSGDDGALISDRKKRQVAEASGFRIRQITDYDAADNPERERHYMYGQMAGELWSPGDLDKSGHVDDYMFGAAAHAHTNVGEAVVDPTLLTYLRYAYHYRDLLYGYDAYPEDFREIILGRAHHVLLDNNCENKSYWEVEVASANFQRLLNGRPQVVYPYVTIYEGPYNPRSPSATQGINGKTAYVYDFMDEHDDGTVSFMEPVIRAMNFNYYIPQRSRYNKLKKRTDFEVINGTYHKVREEINSWAAISEHYIRNSYYFSCVPEDYTLHFREEVNWREKLLDHLSCAMYDSYDSYEDRRLSRKVINDYSGGEFIQSSESYRYGEGGMLTSRLKTNSSGAKIETLISYPQDCRSDIYTRMLSENIRTSPIEHLVKVNGKVCKGHLTTYRLDQGHFVRDAIYELAAHAPLSRFTAFTGGEKDSSYSHRPAVEFMAYNSDVHPTKVHLKNGLYTYYVWGYGGDYPVAKIESGTNTAISIRVNDDNLCFSDDLTDVNHGVSYLKALLSPYINNDHFHVTIYTYKPLVGITSQTTPDGRTTYYDYDDFNRLKTIKNQDGHIIKEYEYNYGTSSP